MENYTAHYTLIDLEKYSHREAYERYLRLHCFYSITVQIDITKLIDYLNKNNMRVYPAQIWLLSKAANNFTEFRMGRDINNRLICWEKISPLYTSLDANSQNFSHIWTGYEAVYKCFYDDCVQDIKQFTNGKNFPQLTLGGFRHIPKNILNISSIPWLDFSGLNINISEECFSPIFTIGMHTKRENKTFMPLAIQLHHAVCDGYHVGKFVKYLNELIRNCDKLL